MKKAVLFFIAAVTGMMIFTSCDSPEGVPFRQVTTIDMDHGIFNYQTVIDGSDAHSGRKFARVDSGAAIVYGLGYSYLIPDSMKGKVIAVNINAWVRTGDLANNCDLAVYCTSSSKSGADSTSLWSGCMAKEFMKNPNEWSQVSRTIVVPAAVTALNNTYIYIMMHNVDTKSYFDMDDLCIEYAEVKEID